MYIRTQLINQNKLVALYLGSVPPVYIFIFVKTANILNLREILLVSYKQCCRCRNKGFSLYIYPHFEYCFDFSEKNTNKLL